MKKKRHALWIAVVTVLTMACGNKQEQNLQTGRSDALTTEQNVPGDSTVYGLACDGSSSTMLVFLPLTGGDPDTFNISAASERQQIFGQPAIGDKLAIMVNRDNPKVADMVIDLEQLKGEWCFTAEPREMGFEIKSEHIVRPIGISRDQSVATDSTIAEKRYRDWRIMNGQLLLSETRRDTAGVVAITHTDTTQFVLLGPDTLVLRFGDGTEQGYYRRSEKLKVKSD